MDGKNTNSKEGGSGSPLEEIIGIDEIIHSPSRLDIMMFLLPRLKATFLTIQETLGLTPGNLSAHLNKLEKNSLIEIQKAFHDTKLVTIVYLTEYGRKKLQEYAKFLVEVLEKMLEDE
ncbi:MAG: transcriptional regulator [Candidatus Thorarchaeota archaeon]